ncbi:helix-turn-helix domain-containing protein [Streptomyces sp. NPDC047841]|uniref:ArsR/SmtB family transcription factor n=1 Tax=Streptomyces sp. NPDC047841 TaxID=3154708 RepID=UPI0034519461
MTDSMLRIHFTARDLENVRIAQQPDPLWELVCAVRRLSTRQEPLVFTGWRRSVADRLFADAQAEHAVRLSKSLIPATGYIPDFLTPPVTGEGLSAGLEQVRATPRERLLRDLLLFAKTRATPGSATGPTDSGHIFAASLAAAFESSFRALLAPYWGPVRSAVGNDVALRSQALLEGGTRALFDGLRPWAHWKAPVLEVNYPSARDLHLGGRGLLLVPSYFCWRRPTSLADPNLDPVLVYPVAKPPLGLVGSSEERLERLLGRTRCAVLMDVARHRGRTTTEIARTLGIAVPSASYQISVLREGGLVVSRRDGKYVLHSATALGRGLLDSSSV